MKTWLLILLIGAHIALGQFMRLYPIVSSVHAYLILGLGIFFALNNQRANIAKVAAYIVASEVLWRMTHARIFWEFGKYALCAIFGLNLITRGWKKPFLPILYFSFLLPSTILLPAMVSWVEMNFAGDVSFNLSGPFTLMLSSLFFFKTKLQEDEMKDLLTVFLRII